MFTPAIHPGHWPSVLVLCITLENRRRGLISLLSQPLERGLFLSRIAMIYLIEKSQRTHFELFKRT